MEIITTILTGLVTIILGIITLIIIFFGIGFLINLTVNKHRKFFDGKNLVTSLIVTFIMSLLF